ncbi:hypothetical protein FACS1894184_12700 [Clostridia bacterium]|nr:hypothetical protein FACS1894184_12700 [Clostridia bacterium]
MNDNQFAIQFNDQTIYVVDQVKEGHTQYLWVLEDLCNLLKLGRWQDIMGWFNPKDISFVDIDRHFEDDESSCLEKAVAVDTYSLIFSLGDSEDPTVCEFAHWMIDEAIPFFTRTTHGKTLREEVTKLQSIIHKERKSRKHANKVRSRYQKQLAEHRRRNS